VLLMRLESDLLELLLATAEGRLAEASRAVQRDVALTGVLAANGYPGTPEKGGAILRKSSAPKAKAGPRSSHAGRADREASRRARRTVGAS
jgi:phosphoribosylamine--glycine ligase